METTFLIFQFVLICNAEAFVFHIFELSEDIKDKTCNANDVHKSSLQSGPVRCAGQCMIQGESCKSFFYSQDTQICDECKTIYNSTSQTVDIVGKSTYYIEVPVEINSIVIPGTTTEMANGTTTEMTTETTTETTNGTTTETPNGTTTETTNGTTAETTNGTTTETTNGTTTESTNGTTTESTNGTTTESTNGTTTETTNGTTTESTNGTTTETQSTTDPETYIGCHSFVAGEETDSFDNNTETVCYEFCSSYMYDIYSTQNKRCDCHGATVMVSLVEQTEDKCEFPCPGNKSEFCGDPAESTSSFYTSAFLG